MLDLTSSLYLGLQHGSSELGRWDALTTGAPAALAEPTCAAPLGARLAGMVGAEGGVVYRSTLHAFTDLFATVRYGAVLLDAAAYPIARWPLAGAACRGGPVATFAHHDPDHLASRLRAAPASAGRPLAVADGFCVGCGRVAPIRGFMRVLEPYAGILVLDDTQALGVLGATPDPVSAYGVGGGGSARWAGVRSPALVHVASLAKAFGAPLALLGGSAGLVQRVRQFGPTRAHSSPPSTVDLLAAARALEINSRDGEKLRARLLALIRRFRQRLAAAGARLAGGLFPVQRLAGTDGERALALHRRLAQAGLRTVVTQPSCQPGPAVTVLLTAALATADVEWAAEVIGAAVASPAGACRSR